MESRVCSALVLLDQLGLSQELGIELAFLGTSGGEATGIQVECCINRLELVLAQQGLKLVESCLEAADHGRGGLKCGTRLSQLRFHVENLLQQTLIGITD